MQAMELPLMSSISSPVENAPAYLVAQCQHWNEAMALCMDLSRIKYTRAKWVEMLGMTGGHLSQLLNKTGERRRYPDPELFPMIERIAGNRAISQFFAMQSRGELDSQSRKLQRIHELQAELAALEKQA